MSDSGRRGLFSILDWLPPPLDFVCWRYLLRILQELDVPPQECGYGLNFSLLRVYSPSYPSHLLIIFFSPLNLSPPASLWNNVLRNKSENPCGLLALPIQHSSTGKAAQFTHRELHEWLLPAAMGTPALPCHGVPKRRQCRAGAPWWEGVGGQTDGGTCGPSSPLCIRLSESLRAL